MGNLEALIKEYNVYARNVASEKSSHLAMEFYTKAYLESRAELLSILSILGEKPPKPETLLSSIICLHIDLAESELVAKELANHQPASHFELVMLKLKEKGSVNLRAKAPQIAFIFWIVAEGNTNRAVENLLSTADKSEVFVFFLTGRYLLDVAR